MAEVTWIKGTIDPSQSGEYYVTLEAKQDMVDDEIRGIRFRYAENTAYCERCGTEVYVPEVNDWNAINRKESYERGKEENER